MTIIEELRYEAREARIVAGELESRDPTGNADSITELIGFADLLERSAAAHEAADARLSAHLEAWKRKSEWHAKRIAELEAERPEAMR